MLQVKYVAWFCLIFIFQNCFAETVEENDEEIDKEFLEILGTIEEESDDWFELFLLAIDEIEAEQFSQTNYD